MVDDQSLLSELWCRYLQEGAEDHCGDERRAGLSA
jgi:hypothetical protein